MNRNTLMLIGLTFLGLYFLKSKTPHTALDAQSVSSPPQAQPQAEWWKSPSLV